MRTRKPSFFLPFLCVIALIFSGFESIYHFYPPSADPAGTTIFGLYSIPQDNSDPVSFRLTCGQNLKAGCYRDVYLLDGYKRKTMTGYGLPVLLNINVTAPVAGNHTTFAQNRDSYLTGLDMAVAACAGNKPAIAVIENEYNNPNYYITSAKDYIRELSWAASYLKTYGIPVADGGTVMPALQYLTWQSLFVKDSRTGKQVASAASDAYRQRTQLSIGSNTLRAAGMLDSVLQVADSIGLSYVNFHRYAHSAADSTSILQEIHYLRTRTKLPLITNECGQNLYDTNPATVTAMIHAFRQGGIVYAAWYNGNSTTGVRARALSKANGTNLPNGDAFANR